MGVLTQMWPPKPTYTEADVGDQAGKVYIITGANTGVGKELAKILYSKNATVHIAARSEDKARAAIKDIQSAVPHSRGQLKFLAIDLSDLKSVENAAKSFIASSDRLDVLFNNAGVMHPPPGSQTVQGYELQLGVHNLAPVLFSELLAPLLAQTVKADAAVGIAGRVRVVWVSSSYAEIGSPKGGFHPDNIDYTKKDESKYFKYSASKAGVYYQGTQYAKRYKQDGIISISLNPGNLKSDLQRHHGSILSRVGREIMLFPPINGAYTELFAGLTPDINLELSGSYVIPWGRLSPIRSDLEDGARSKSEGGTGMGEVWYKWCLDQVKPFM